MDHHEFFNCLLCDFRGGQSCLNQLISHNDQVTSILESRKAIDVGVTLRKFKLLGIRGQGSAWEMGYGLPS